MTRRYGRLRKRRATPAERWNEQRRRGHALSARQFFDLIKAGA